MSLTEFFFKWQVQFINETARTGKSVLTSQGYERVIEKFGNYIGKLPLKSIDEIDYIIINDFITFSEKNSKRLKNNEFQYKTKILYITVLKIFFSFIEDISDNKYSFNIRWKRIKFKKLSKEKGHIEKSIESKVLSYLDNLIVRAERVKDWNKINRTQKKEIKNIEYVHMLNFTFKLGVYLGLRASEICSVRLCDISKPYKTSTNQQLIDISILGKGNKERTMPIIYSRIKKEHIFFSKIREIEETLFKKINGKPLDRISLYNYFKELGEHSKTDIKGCHILRHTFGFKMSDNGVDVADAQDMLGHSNITTTRIYFKSNPNRMRRVATMI